MTTRSNVDKRPAIESGAAGKQRPVQEHRDLIARLKAQLAAAQAANEGLELQVVLYRYGLARTRGRRRLRPGSGIEHRFPRTDTRGWSWLSMRWFRRRS